MSDDQIICTCLDLSKGEIATEIKKHCCKSTDDVADAIEAGAVCGSCVDDIQEILDEVNA